MLFAVVLHRHLPIQVRKGDDGRRPSASTFFSSDDSAGGGGGRPGPDPQALRAFEKLGGFAAMGRQLELHVTCQAVCDALMGMIFGVWGSKHEPRPIREKDVLAIKGNKESWLRCGAVRCGVHGSSGAVGLGNLFTFVALRTCVIWGWMLFAGFRGLDGCCLVLCFVRKE